MIYFTSEDVFLVTGASSGIGEAIALKLCGLGGKVVAIGRNSERLDAVKSKSSSHGLFHPEQKELTGDLDSLTDYVKELAARHGKFRGFVHSAGIVELVPLQGIDANKIRKIFDINFTAGAMLAKGFSRRTCNTGSNASIVFVSSTVSLLGSPGQIIYGASKGAVNSMMKSMAVELARKGIRVNAVLPGHIATPAASDLDDAYSAEYLNELKTMYPLGPGSPSDVAGAVAFLLSDSARWITGQAIAIDGGRMLF